MDEFEFLDAQFRRLAEARGLRYRDEQKIDAQQAGKKAVPHSPFETAELMVAGSIRDYLKMRHIVKLRGDPPALSAERPSRMEGSTP